MIRLSKLALCMVLSVAVAIKDHTYSEKKPHIKELQDLKDHDLPRRQQVLNYAWITERYAHKPSFLIREFLADRLNRQHVDKAFNLLCSSGLPVENFDWEIFLSQTMEQDDKDVAKMYLYKFREVFLLYLQAQTVSSLFTSVKIGELDLCRYSNTASPSDFFLQTILNDEFLRLSAIPPSQLDSRKPDLLEYETGLKFEIHDKNIIEMFNRNQAKENEYFEQLLDYEICFLRPNSPKLLHAAVELTISTNFVVQTGFIPTKTMRETYSQITINSKIMKLLHEFSFKILKNSLRNVLAVKISPFDSFAVDLAKYHLEHKAKFFSKLEMILSIPSLITGQTVPFLGKELENAMVGAYVALFGLTEKDRPGQSSQKNGGPLHSNFLIKMHKTYSSLDNLNDFSAKNCARVFRDAFKAQIVLVTRSLSFQDRLTISKELVCLCQYERLAEYLARHKSPQNITYQLFSANSRKLFELLMVMSFGSESIAPLSARMYDIRNELHLAQSTNLEEVTAVLFSKLNHVITTLQQHWDSYDIYHQDGKTEISTYFLAEGLLGVSQAFVDTVKLLGNEIDNSRYLKVTEKLSLMKIADDFYGPLDSDYKNLKNSIAAFFSFFSYIRKIENEYRMTFKASRKAVKKVFYRFYYQGTLPKDRGELDKMLDITRDLNLDSLFMKKIVNLAKQIVTVFVDPENIKSRLSVDLEQDL